MKKLSFFLMAIVASLGLAWAVGGDSLLPQLKGALGGLTDGTSLAETRSVNVVGLNIYVKGHNGDWFTSVSPLHMTDVDLSEGIKIKSWDNSNNFYWKLQENDGWKIELGKELNLVSTGDNAEYTMKLDGVDASKKYDVTIDFGGDVPTIFVVEHGTSADYYALQADFLSNDEGLEYDGDREGWGARMFVGPDADGWYTLQTSVYGAGSFVVQNLAGNALNAQEKGYFAGDVNITAKDTDYTLSSSEDFATFSLNAGTYKFSYNPATNVIKVQEIVGYYIIGTFNDWSVTDGYYEMTEQEDGTYKVVMNRVLGSNASFVIIKNLDKVSRNTTFTKKGTIIANGSTTKLNAGAGFDVSNALKTAESFEMPEFTYEPTSRNLTVKKWENPNIWNNPNEAYGDYNVFLLKGASITYNNNTYDWNSTNSSRPVFQKSTNDRFNGEDGWLVLNKVKFNQKEFGIVRAHKTSKSQYDANSEGHSKGWIWAKAADNNTVDAQIVTEAAYENYGGGKNFMAATTGTYDVYFNPTTMQIIFGGSYAWQLYGNISVDHGAYEPLDLNNDPENPDLWTIELANVQGGRFTFRHSDPTEDTGWRVVGSKQNAADVNSNLVKGNGVYPGSEDNREDWISSLDGSAKLIFNERDLTLTVEGATEAATPLRVRFTFESGEVYEDYDGLLRIQNMNPHSHDNEVEDHKHGATIEVLMSDGSRKYLVSGEGEEGEFTLGVNQKLVLSNEKKTIYFKFDGLLDPESTFNFALNWADIDNATITIRKVGDYVEVEPTDYYRYLVHGNVWGSNNWDDVAELLKVDDDWYVARNVSIDGTNFGIILANAEGEQYSGNDGKTSRGWWYGTPDDYYINDGNVHKCVNEFDYGEGKGHNLVLGQAGTYTIYFSPTREEIIVYGNYAPTNFGTLYFVDRKFENVNVIGNVHGYAYNNEGVDPEGGKNSMEDVLTKWAGTALNKLDNSHPLYSMVDGENVSIYSFEFDLNRFPRVIFNNGESGIPAVKNQTRNFRAIANGVYYFDDELLPTNYYVVDPNGNADLLLYPNEYDQTVTNTIYVDVDGFAQYITANAENQISFSIAWEKDGHRYVTTGIRGTTTGVYVEIAGKKYIRLTLAEAAIPNGTPMELYVWEGTNMLEYANKCGVAGHTHGIYVDGEGADKDDYTCTNDDRVLAFQNVTYVNGGIYKRGQAEPDNIYEVMKPSKVEIYSAGAGLYLPPVSTTGNKIAVPSRELAADENLCYTFEGVTVDSDFKFKVQIGENTYWYVYDPNTTTNMRPMQRYNANSTEAENFSGYYHIQNPSSYSHIEKYNITFDWLNHDVYVVPVGNEPGFRMQHLDPQFFDYNHYVVRGLPDEGSWNFGGKNEPITTVAMPSTALLVSHADAFGGSTSINEDHFAAVNVTVAPKADYSQYFSSGTKNKQAVIGKLAPLTAEDGTFTANRSVADVKAFTAGHYTVGVESGNIEENGAVIFKRQRANFDMIVTPTVESIGLTINGNLIVPEFTDGDYTYVPDAKPLYVVVDPTKVYTSGNLNGTQIKWDPAKRTYMHAYMADNDQVEVYYRIDAKQGEEPQAQARSIVRREASADAPDVNAGTGVVPEGYTKYDIYNSLNNDNLGLTEGSTEPAQVSFVVKQNGIVGHPQTVNVYAALPANVPTAVEEIELPEDEVLGAEGVEVVYDINGIRVDAENLAPGVYVVVKGDKTEKVYIK